MLKVPTLEKLFELDAARRIVGEFADLIRPACERLEVCGSIRRGQPTVKDADLVAIPGAGLLALLDDLLARHVVEKALYGESKATRWGPKLRGMIFQGLQIEIDLADENNWGYKKALRSGPKSANEYIMSFISWRKPALRFQDGCGWYSPGNLWHKPNPTSKWLADDKVQLSIPDEETLFALLGMPYLAPNLRSEEQYKRLMGNNRQHRWPDFSRYVLKLPEAIRLVNVESVQPESAKIKAGSAHTAISPFSVTAANAAEWAQQVRAETLARTERQLSECLVMAGTYPSYARRVGVLKAELVILRGLVK